MRMKDQTDKNIFKKYMLTNLTILLVIHQKILRIYSILKYTFLFFGQLQSASFYLFPNHISSRKLYNKFILIYLVRPDLLANDDKQHCYLFIIPLASIFIFELLILQGQVLLEYKYKSLPGKQHQQILIQSSIQKLMIYLKSLYSQLFIVYLYIPAQILSFTSFTFSKIFMDIEITILSLFTIVVYILLQMIKLIASNTAMDLQISGYERLQFTKMDFLREILMLLQIILYSIMNDTEKAQIFQGVLSIFVSLTFLINIFIDKTVVVERQITLTLITQISLITIILTSLLNYWQLGILIIPFFIFLGLSQRNKELSNLLTNISQNKNISIIIQYISYQINNYTIYKSTVNQISQSILLNYHKKKCIDVSCFCNTIDQKTEEPNKVLYISDQFHRKFVINKIKQWNKDISKNRQNFSDQCLIHYITTLNHYGLTTLAFQECQRLLSQQNYINSGFLSQNDFNSLSQNQLLSQPSQQSGTQIKKLQAKQFMNSYELRFDLKLNIRNRMISQLSKIKLEIISKDIRQELQNNFLKLHSKQQQEITQAIELYLLSEQQNQAVKQQVIECLQQKLLFYNFILNQKSLKSQELFSSAKTLSKSLMKLEQQLLQQYTKFPSQKLQSINCFFQSEILNNYLTAYKLANFNTIADEKLLNLKKNIKINLFGKNVIHMLMNLSDGQTTMDITQFSNNAQDFLQVSYEDCIQQYKTIDNLLPHAIRNEHHMLVQRFIFQGTSKYFRNIDLSFLQLSYGLLKPFNLCIDIILNKTNNLSFAAFFEEAASTNFYILVDVNEQCGGITQNIFERLGWKQSEIKKYSNQLNLSYQVKINQIIPSFNDLKLLIKEQKIISTSINLLTKKAIINLHQKSVLSINDSWKNMANLIQLSGTIVIKQRELYGYYYYILEIEDIRLNQALSHMTSNEEKGITFQLNPIENCTAIEIEASDLILSGKDIEINKPYSLNIFPQSPSIQGKDEDDNIFSNQNLYEVLKRQQNLQERETVASKLLQFNSSLQYQDYNINNISKSNEKQNFVDYNPNQSVRKLIDTSKSFAQQRFFNQEIQEFDQSNSKIGDVIKNGIKDLDQQYNQDFNKIDKELKEDIKLQLQLEFDQRNQGNHQLDDAASQVSSLIGLKKSQFLKKYELFNRLIDSQFRPVSYRYFNLLILLSQVVIIVYCIIILQNLSQDFNRFIQEIDMLLFSYSFMTPFDIFLALRFSTIYYRFQLFTGRISASEDTQLENWLSEHLGEGYDVMKQNFLEQFSNPYILEFFTDQNFDVMFMNANSSNLEQKTISFRESLNVLLQYQYQFKIAYMQNIPLVSQAFTAYPYANYLNLHDKFNNMTSDILVYTKQRKETVQQNWTNIWIPFLVIDFLLILGCYQYYKSYLLIYQSFLNLFKYTDVICLNRDLERYKTLINLLTKNSDVMFKYHFDLEQKEKFMIAERYKIENKGIHDFKKKKNYKTYKQLPTFLGFVSLSIVLLVYFIFSFFIWLQTNDYLDRYAHTADIYKYIGDLCYKVPGLFSQRQFLYWWNLYYSDALDKPRMQSQIFDGIESCKRFDPIIQQFNDENYLTTQNFVDALDNLTKKPICDFFNETQQLNYQFYCNRSFEGALTMGITQALIYIGNAFTVAYASNNFTSIVQYLKYEAEGMYIITNGLIELVKSFKNAMLQATSSHMSLITILSSILLIFQLVMFFFQLCILHRYHLQEYQLVRRFILLLPSSTVLFDDNFERNIRIFSTQVQI